MKQVLSLLTAFVFLQMQTWALSGGPVYPTGSPNLAGIYSGAMIPQNTKFGVGVIENSEPTAGSNGVFTITIAQTGLSVGTLLFFVNGTIFSGAVTGVADPDKSTFEGVIQAAGLFGTVIAPARFVVTVNGTLVFVPEIIDAPDALGTMKLKIIEKPQQPLSGFADTANGNSARMTGTAKIDVFVTIQNNQAPDQLVQAKYNISGFRQQTTALQ